MKRTLAVLVSGILLLGPGAEAHVKTHRSQIAINVQGTVATGGVGPNTIAGCTADRVVTVTRHPDGAFMGSTTTDPSGGWQVIAGYVAGTTYIASTPRVRIKRNAAHRHYCSAASAFDEAS